MKATVAYNKTEVLRGNADGQTTDRYLRAAAERRARRSAGWTSNDRLYRSPAGPAAHAAVLRRAEGGGSAGRAGLGGRAGQPFHPQRHPPRRALALSSDHEPRRAFMDH